MEGKLEVGRDEQRMRDGLKMQVQNTKSSKYKHSTKPAAKYSTGKNLEVGRLVALYLYV